MDQMNNNNWIMFYRGEHYINIIRGDNSTENEYNVTLFTQSIPTTCIKFIIRNLENDLDSYTSYITSIEFEDMKVKQNLLLSYSDLSEQIKSLLEQNLCSENRVNLRLYEVENNTLELGIFTKSDLKELILLVIPFKFTSTNDIICYLKEKNENESIQKQVYQEKTEILNSELQNLHLKYRHLYSNFNTACQKIAEIERQNNILLDENNHLKQCVLQLETDKKSNMKNIDLSTNTINNLEKYVAELKADMMGLQVGITYYSDSNKALKDALRQLEAKSVPKDKYLAIRNMFSSAVVDLAKCQISLSKLAALHEGQKDENLHLQNEIRSLTNLVSGLENNLKSETAASEDVTEIRNLIEQLELKTSKSIEKKLEISKSD